eukprot:scaffold34795_cov112-Isochrysis_galbana.AAC.2
MGGHDRVQVGQADLEPTARGLLFVRRGGARGGGGGARPEGRFHTERVHTGGRISLIRGSRQLRLVEHLRGKLAGALGGGEHRDAMDASRDASTASWTVLSGGCVASGRSIAASRACAASTAASASTST